MLFWLGKIRDVHNNASGICVRLTVQWYEVYDNKDSFRGNYADSRLYRSRKVSVGDVHVATVLVTFEKLTQSR